MREIIWNIWAANSMSESFNLERRQIMLLPWDEKLPDVIEPTLEELEEISKRFDAAAIASLNNRMNK